MKYNGLKVFILLFIITSSCAYYNTFFNAKEYFKIAEKEREKRLDKQKKERNKKNNRQLDRLSSSELENYKNSIEKASKVLEIYSKSKYVDDALFLLGKCFFRKRDYSKAKRKFHELIENYPKSEFVQETRLWLGKTNIEFRDYETAEKNFHDILNSPVKDIIRDEAQFLLGGLFKHKGDYVTAVSEFTNAANNAKDKSIRAKAFFEMGECYYILKNYEKSAESYKLAKKFSPDEKFEFNTMLKAGLALKDQEQYDEAINIFTNLLGSQNDATGKENQAICRIEIAHCHRLNKDFSSATEWYSDIIEKHPKSIEAATAYFYFGEIYQQQEADYEQAKEYYDNAVKENAKAEIRQEAQAKSKSIKQLLELRNNITAQQQRIAAGDSVAAAIETMDEDEDEINKSILKFSNFDTLVMTSLYLPLDSLAVYQDTLMGIYDVYFKDYEEEQENEFDKFKPGYLDTLIATSLKLPMSFIVKFEDSLKNVYDRFYPTYKKNKLLYDVYLEQTRNNKLNITNEGETPKQALVKAKLSLAEIYLFEFEQPDSALKVYIDVLEMDSSKEAIPKTLYSIGYICKTFKNDTLLADSVFNRLVTNYPDHPLSHHAKQRIKTIAIPDLDEEIIEKFILAEHQYLEANKYTASIRTLEKIIQDYPSSKYAPKSLLTMGWIYENNLNQQEKAFEIYQSIIDKYPESAYAKSIKTKVDAVIKFRTAPEETQSTSSDTSAIKKDSITAAADTTQSVILATMDKEQYRRHLRLEMDKNDPRRSTPKRW